MDLLAQRFAGRVLGVATMHGKERVIAPPLIEALSLKGAQTIEGLDTDRFGAFSGEVRRSADPRTTAIAKARHGVEVGGLDLVVASEGSFGPYPPAPFLSCNEEFLVLLDATDGSIYDFRHMSLETRFGGAVCHDLQAVERFAGRMDMPAQGLVLRPAEQWKSGDPLEKGVRDPERLRASASAIIARHGSVWVETDMRAMMNPTRMQVIGEAAGRFAQELTTTCPACAHFFFRVTGSRTGLPCALCGLPTDGILGHARGCIACGYVQDVPRPDGRRTEDPRSCGHCNP